jgi:hypothetical protein
MPVEKFDFESIGQSEIQWPKRGRKPKPLPGPLVKALQDSFANESVPHLDMPTNQVASFGNLLSAAGRKLNMRIERHIEEDVPEPGMSRFHFRARSKRNSEVYQ